MANGNVKDAHYGCVLGHLMNNSYRLGEEVPFNQKAGRFGDNKDAFEHFGKLHEIMGDRMERLLALKLRTDQVFGALILSINLAAKFRSGDTVNQF